MRGKELFRLWRGAPTCNYTTAVKWQPNHCSCIRSVPCTYEYWAGGYDSDIRCDWIVIISSLSVRWVLDRCTSAIQNRQQTLRGSADALGFADAKQGYCCVTISISGGGSCRMNKEVPSFAKIRRSSMHRILALIAPWYSCKARVNYNSDESRRMRKEVARGERALYAPCLPRERSDVRVGVGWWLSFVFCWYVWHWCWCCWVVMSIVLFGDIFLIGQ